MADRQLIEPVKIQFAGIDAAEHRMDALLLGKSLSGIARVYNSVGHLHFHGQLRTSEHTDIRVQAGPPKPGTIWYLIYLMVVHGKMAVYPELLFEAAGFVVPAFVKAIIAKKTGQGGEMDKALDIIRHQSDQYHELASAMQAAGVERERRAEQREDRLLGLVEMLATQNRGPLADLAAPVGRTVAEVRQLPHGIDPIVVDAPTAESLRSPEEVTVGETQRFRGTITALDTKTGAFKFEEADSGRELRGKITDPALTTPQNVYSHALDTKVALALVAKPTLRADGGIHKLFVSDATN
ncbi:hypothetical protein [Arvimicrobium flavum]|uniref:DUF7946 domain-containing protein n=1 Tax=Arvimicrobium flavum TaxID=3393320 RepID=UPI00237BD9CC|nr:hypothetical protein [Mesorhizobium shangrilense]